MRWPGNSNIADSKGWVLYRLGRLAEAEDWLRRAATQSDSAVVTSHLGDVLNARGDVAAAVEQWRIALGQEPDERTRAALEEKVRQAEVAAPAAAKERP